MCDLLMRRYNQSAARSGCPVTDDTRFNVNRWFHTMSLIMRAYCKASAAVSYCEDYPMGVNAALYLNNYRIDSSKRLV
jgi:hypothetical protein